MLFRVLVDDHRDLLLLLGLDLGDGGVDLHLLLLEREPLQALLEHLRLARLELRRRVLAAELDVHLGLQLAPEWRRRRLVLQPPSRRGAHQRGAEEEQKRGRDHVAAPSGGLRRARSRGVKNTDGGGSEQRGEEEEEQEQELEQE